MSVYSVERVKQIMDCLTNKAVEPLVANSYQCEQVESWLCDEASRAAYRRELVYLILRNLVSSDVQANLSGTMRPEEWDAIVAQVHAGIESGALPQMEYPANVDTLDVHACVFVVEQYHYKNLVTVRQGDVFLDCGACCGESAVWAAGKGAKKIYSFEPVSDCFPYFERNAARYAPQSDITLVPVGISDAPGFLNVQWCPGDLVGSTRLVPGEPGEGAVPVVTLDDWCAENGVAPDFIKMDLEGAEPAALLGGREIIAKHKPRLAICLYHNFSDMWTIPHIIKDICPEYRFWCKKNHPNWEFVLYASV